MVLRHKFDVFGYLGGIFILMALMFMIFWYICSLEVEDREMPKIVLPRKSKAPPKVCIFKDLKKNNFILMVFTYKINSVAS